jgi:hypothetical protein
MKEKQSTTQQGKFRTPQQSEEDQYVYKQRVYVPVACDIPATRLPQKSQDVT